MPGRVGYWWETLNLSSLGGYKQTINFIFYLFIYLFASDTHNLDHMYPYQLLVAVVKKKGKQC